MKTRILFVLFGLLLAPTAMAQINDNDFQVWTELALKYRLGEYPVSLHLAEENRFDRNASRYQTFNTTLGVHYDPTSWLTLSLLYRYEKVRGVSGENRAMPQFEIADKIGPLAIKNRHRLENRFIGSNYRFRYRTRLYLAYVFPTESLELGPYVSDEIFIEPENGLFNQNRLQGGLGLVALDGVVRISVYYMLKQDQSSVGWRKAHVMGTGFSLSY